MSHNKIQIYGLRRSGTNFLENLILKYFDPLYHLIITNQNIHPLHPKYNKKVSLKHTLPNFNYSKFIIIVYKPYEEWVKSVTRKYGDKSSIYKIWESFSNESLKIYNPKNTIITDWYTAATNYESLIYHISEKFNLPILNPNTSPPLNKLGTDSGKEFLNQKFTLQPYGEYNETDNLLLKLKEKSWNIK
jgi:hypothetical protein